MFPSSNYSIKTFCGGYDENYTYLITCSHTGTQVMIDASINIKKMEILQKKYINIGIAVDTKHGLIVPIIKNILGYIIMMKMIGKITK